MRPKYILIGERILSRETGDVHYISPTRLLGLYQLDPKECILLNEGDALKGMKDSEFIVLGPRYRGDYLEHLAEEQAKRKER